MKTKNIYDVIFGKYRKFKNLKISNIFEKAIVLIIICNKCKNEDKKIFKEEESIELSQIFNLIKGI